MPVGGGTELSARRSDFSELQERARKAVDFSSDQEALDMIDLARTYTSLIAGVKFFVNSAPASRLIEMSEILQVARNNRELAEGAWLGVDVTVPG